MDTFIEKIVRRQKKTKDRLMTSGLVFLGFVLFIVVLNIPFLQTFNIFILAAIVYGIYYLSSSTNIEYEFILTNDELDIDKIVSRRKRKRVFSASCKNFDVLARVSSEKYAQETRNIKKRIEAISSINSPDVFFATLNYKGERTVVLFEPDERMINLFKTYIPKKFFA